jgi:hypothetical protein
VILLAERPRLRAPVIHRMHHREVAEELSRWPRQEGAGEDAQASLGRVGASAKRRNHPSGSDRAVPCPRSRSAPDAAASPLRHDGLQGPLGGDRDRAVTPVAA